MVEAVPLGSAKHEIEYVCVKEETVDFEVPHGHDDVQDPLSVENKELASSEDFLESRTFNIEKTEDEEDEETVKENGLEELEHEVESISGSEHGSVITVDSEDDTSPAPVTGNGSPSTSKQQESCANKNKTGASHPGHRCDICNKVFVHVQDLENHSRVDCRKVEPLCNICHKTFTTSRSYKRHLRVVHNGERPYSCDFCYKTFAENSSLKHHLLLHTGERPYSCGVCGKTFIQKTHLKYHSRIHSGERPFKCDICGKTFIHNTHLKEHSRLHTDERPYACSVCSKTFNQRSHLKRHLLLHTGMRPYTCSVCNQTFAQTETLKKHLRMHANHMHLQF